MPSPEKRPGEAGSAKFVKKGSPSKNPASDETEPGPQAETESSDLQGGKKSASPLKRAEAKGKEVASETDDLQQQDIRKPSELVETSSAEEKTEKVKSEATAESVRSTEESIASSKSPKRDLKFFEGALPSEKKVVSQEEVCEPREIPTISVTSFAEVTSGSAKPAAKYETVVKDTKSKAMTTATSESTLSKEAAVDTKPGEGAVGEGGNVPIPTITKSKTTFVESKKVVDKKSNSPKRISPKKSSPKKTSPKKSSPVKVGPEKVSVRNFKPSSSESEAEAASSKAEFRGSISLAEEVRMRKEKQRDFAKVVAVFQESSLYDRRVSKVRLKISAHNYKPKRIEPNVVVKNTRFRILFDVSRFDKASIVANVVDDKIDVYAKEETKNEYGFELHEMHQIFQIPDYVDKSGLNASVTENEMLFIDAPVKGVASKDTR